MRLRSAKQVCNDAEPFRIEWLPAHRLACPTVAEPTDHLSNKLDENANRIVAALIRRFGVKHGEKLSGV